MKLSEFKYNLPTNLIAYHPTNYRDESRLMVLHRETGKIEHKTFSDIIDYFDEGDVLIKNDTKVFPARLFGEKEKTGAQIEVFLLRELNPEIHLWDALVDPARKIRVGNKLYFGPDTDNPILVAEVIDNTTSRGRTIKFLFEDSRDKLWEILDKLGEVPLPKYIKRKPVPEDKERYQTIYAKNVGSVAAPTAGLHFSHQLLKRLDIKGIISTEVTVHIGIGTFRSVDVEDLTKHKMDSEQFSISEETADTVNKALDAKKRICAVGTSTTRAIETSISANNRLKPANKQWTNKFIFPPYDFAVANSMITNFHMPESTLLILVAAFAGYENIMNAYNIAIKEQYRFYSYGDSMLII